MSVLNKATLAGNISIKLDKNFKIGYDKNKQIDQKEIGELIRRRV